MTCAKGEHRLYVVTVDPAGDDANWAQIGCERCDMRTNVQVNLFTLTPDFRSVTTISLYARIPAAIWVGLRRYVDDRIMPGGFLQSVLANDLQGAVSRADQTSLAALPALVMYVHNELPGNCWGSRDRLQEWVATERATP